MKPLPTSIRRDGFTFVQHVRNDHAAVYRQEREGEECAFEVIRIGRHDGYTVGGRYVPAGESYPGSGAWGSRGWTEGTLEAALRRFEGLTPVEGEEQETAEVKS